MNKSKCEAKRKHYLAPETLDDVRQADGQDRKCSCWKDE